MSRFSIETFREKFPVEVFSEEIQLYINDSFDKKGFHHSYTGLAILSAVSFSIGGFRWLEVNREWRVSPHIWGMVTGTSADTKTHPIKNVFLPVMEENAALLKSYLDKKDLFDDMMDDYKKRSKTSNLSKPSKPMIKSTVLSNSTIEAAGVVLRDNPEGLIYLPGEMITFLNGLKANGKDTRGDWINIDDREDIIPHRIGRDVFIARKPFVCLLGTIQYERLIAFIKENNALDGFIERFDFALPTPNVEIVQTGLAVENKYSSYMKNMIMRIRETGPKQFDIDRPDKYIPLSKEFHTEYFKFKNAVRKEYKNDGRREPMAIKVSDRLFKYAFALCFMYEEDPVEVDVKYFHLAHKLYKYFLHTSFEVLDLVEGIDPLKFMGKLERKALLELPKEVTTAAAIEIFKKNNLTIYRWNVLRKDTTLFENLKGGGLYGRLY